MAHVIVTARSLGWLLLSLLALTAVLGALVSPRWVVASPGNDTYMFSMESLSNYEYSSVNILFPGLPPCGSFPKNVKQGESLGL